MHDIVEVAAILLISVPLGATLNTFLDLVIMVVADLVVPLVFTIVH